MTTLLEAAIKLKVSALIIHLFRLERGGGVRFGAIHRSRSTSQTCF